MSISISYPRPTNNISILVTKESLEIFKTLVFRATNLWPDAPAEIKEFADVLIHGEILQDYAAQDTSKQKLSPVPSITK